MTSWLVQKSIFRTTPVRLILGRTSAMDEKSTETVSRFLSVSIFPLSSLRALLESAVSQIESTRHLTVATNFDTNPSFATSGVFTQTPGVSAGVGVSRFSERFSDMRKVCQIVAFGAKKWGYWEDFQKILRHSLHSPKIPPIIPFVRQVALQSKPRSGNRG
jgi:hypothetical protein